MSLEPILAFFLIRYLRRYMKMVSPDKQWNQIFTYTLYGIVALFIFQFVFHLTHIVTWIWMALLLAIMLLIYKNPRFEFAKRLMYASMPLILLDVFSESLKAVKPAYAESLENYIGLAFGVAITWLVATIIKSNKQQKALEAERQKTQAEEERSKFIAAQKDELEVLVKERTSEILKQKEDLQHALSDLRETQALLIQSEKMASLGELTAGIAHEIQNPLNFVNNFSEVNTELIDELKAELTTGNIQLAKEIAGDIKENSEKISHHGKRADAIVKGMLEHSRVSTGVKEPTDINALADEYLRLSYHGLRAKDKSFNATIKTDFDPGIGKIDIVAQDVGRVLLNLINNAFYACSERSRSAASLPSPEKIGTGKRGFKNPLINHEPTVWVSTSRSVSSGEGRGEVVIKVRDNGPGIPENIIDKIFQPFFTTKPTGEGTGLGLSLSYDIVKAHGGEIKVESKEGEGTEFIVSLPVD